MLPPPIIRVLIVEDNAAREQKLRDWLPSDVRPVVASSAGKALGILRLDRGRVYAGIILDHDLQERPASDADQFLCGQDVVKGIIEHMSTNIPILVHSVNASQSATMVQRLRGAGFGVTKIPMDVLTKDAFEAWIQHVCETWAELQE